MAEATAPLANRCLTQDIDLLALVSEPAAFDLLAACCGAELNPANHPHFVQLLESVVDRAGLFDAAEHHGLIPLLFEQASVYPERMPAAMLDQLRARYEGTSRRALWFANELTQVLEHLQSMEVEAIAHK